MAELGTTRRRIVDELKRRGPMSATDLGGLLGVTATAIRQHLDSLEGNGLVERTEAMPTGGRGRPGSRWKLTELARELFPDRHADLTVELIAAIREAVGDDGLSAVVERRTERQRQAYAAVVGEGDSLADRVQELADQRTSEGYMAEVIDDTDGLLLVEHHCPICDAAEACQGLCAGELDLFRSVLGDNVDIERVEHLLSGDSRCAYRVTPVTIG